MNTELHDFYVTLPSNTSTDTFPNNTPSEYTAKLSQRIELSGKWEVALHTISYVKWNTIKPNKESLHYIANGTKKTGLSLKDYYANVKEYVADMNASVLKADKGKDCIHYSSREKLRLLWKTDTLFIYEENRLSFWAFSHSAIQILLRRLPLRKQVATRQICTGKQAFMFTVISLSRKLLETKLFRYWILFGTKKKETVK